MALSIKQKILLDLMVRSDRIMKEHDIKYFLFGGSTLGALRHDGFIPWDDDIDIIMDAENYYKLEKVFADGPVDGIDLVFFHNDANWYRSFAMLVNLDDTCYTVPVMYSDGMASGSRIDVMICDYVPEDRLEEYAHDLMIYEEILTDSLMIDINVYKIRDEYLEMREKLARKGKTALEKELRAGLESYATSDDDQLVVRFWTKDLRHYDRDGVYPQIYHNFEGHMLPIPSKPQEQMRLQFGNDWYIIPEQDEYMFHSFTDNYFISGNNYHEDIMQFVDREEGEDIVRKRKALILKRADYTQENLAFQDNLAFQREMMRANFEQEAGSYETMIVAGDHEGLYKRLFALMKVSSGSASSVEKAHKHIPEKLMKAWIRSCIYCGRYYDAEKLIAAFELEEDDTYDEEIDLLERVVDLAVAYQDEKVDDLKNCLDAFSEEESRDIPDCILGRAILTGIDGEPSKEILNLCDRYLAKIPGNYEIMKLKADILYNNDNREEAMSLYSIVHEKTTNGLDLHDIENRFDFTPRFEREEMDPFDIMIGHTPKTNRYEYNDNDDGNEEERDGVHEEDPERPEGGTGDSETDTEHM